MGCVKGFKFSFFISLCTFEPKVWTAAAAFGKMQQMNKSEIF